MVWSDVRLDGPVDFGGLVESAGGPMPAEGEVAGVGLTSKQPAAKVRDLQPFPGWGRRREHTANTLLGLAESMQFGVRVGGTNRKDGMEQCDQQHQDRDDPNQCAKYFQERKARLNHAVR